MGYINNTLPKYLSKLGHDVDLITTNKSPYYSAGSANKIFGHEFSEKNKLEENSFFNHNNFNVSVLPSNFFIGKLKLYGLRKKLKEINPDLIFIFQVTGWLAIDCSLYSSISSARLISGNHTGLSSLNIKNQGMMEYLKSFIFRKIPGFFVSLASFKCIVPTIDCGLVAKSQLGIQKNKLSLLHLPVDNEYFYKSQSSYTRDGDLRAKLNINKDEVVCIFSGKLSNTKNPLIIAKAISKLRKNGFKINGIFIGEGEQAEELKSFESVHVLPFVPISELGGYFRSCDIGIWTSESISYLDAACCGLPLVLSDFVKDIDHLNEFTLVYKDNDIQSLYDALSELMDDRLRNVMSVKALQLAEKRFSAIDHAVRRIEISGLKIQ